MSHLVDVHETWHMHDMIGGSEFAQNKLHQLANVYSIVTFCTYICLPCSGKDFRRHTLSKHLSLEVVCYIFTQRS